MRRRHLRGVMAIERQVYARPWSPNLFVSEMTEQSNRCYLVAKADKVVVGYGGLICYGDEAHVTNIAVDPQLQRLGIGTLLLHQLITNAIAIACPRIPKRSRTSFRSSGASQRGSEKRRITRKAPMAASARR